MRRLLTVLELLTGVVGLIGGVLALEHAAGRADVAALKLGRVAGLQLYGTCSGRDRAAVERLGAVAIDYRNEDFLARVRELPGKGIPARG